MINLKSLMKKLEKTFVPLSAYFTKWTDMHITPRPGARLFDSFLYTSMQPIEHKMTLIQNIFKKTNKQKQNNNRKLNHIFEDHFDTIWFFITVPMDYIVMYRRGTKQTNTQTN